MELTKNAEIKQSVLVEKYGSSKSEISRQVNYVKQNLLSEIRANFNVRRFDLNSTKIISGTLDNLDDLKPLIAAFQSPYAPPFRLGLNILDDGFLLLMQLPVFQEPALVYSILDRYPLSKVYTVDVGPGGVAYPFYLANYDPQTKDWRSDFEYIVTDPLRELGL